MPLKSYSGYFLGYGYCHGEKGFIFSTGFHSLNTGLLRNLTITRKYQIVPTLCFDRFFEDVLKTAKSELEDIKKARMDKCLNSEEE